MPCKDISGHDRSMLTADKGRSILIRKCMEVITMLINVDQYFSLFSIQINADQSWSRRDQWLIQHGQHWLALICLGSHRDSSILTILMWINKDQFECKSSIRKSDRTLIGIRDWSFTSWHFHLCDKFSYFHFPNLFSLVTTQFVSESSYKLQCWSKETQLWSINLLWAPWKRCVGLWSKLSSLLRGGHEKFLT